MTTKICACCGQPFQPRPQVKDQAYCSAPACQRARRQTWQRKKLRDEPYYQEYLRNAQRAWRDRNPAYSRLYRATNPEYAAKNRQQQRAKPDARDDELNLAKMAASIWLDGLPAGLYRIRPVRAPGIAKTDAWIVEITPVCVDCPCKTDACKDSTS